VLLFLLKTRHRGTRLRHVIFSRAHVPQFNELIRDLIFHNQLNSFATKFWP
jgi:hypothetical protein